MVDTPIISGESEVQGHSQIHTKVKANLSYLRPHLEKEKNEGWRSGSSVKIQCPLLASVGTALLWCTYTHRDTQHQLRNNAIADGQGQSE